MTFGSMLATGGGPFVFGSPAPAAAPTSSFLFGNPAPAATTTQAAPVPVGMTNCWGGTTSNAWGAPFGNISQPAAPAAAPAAVVYFPAGSKLADVKDKPFPGGVGGAQMTTEQLLCAIVKKKYECDTQRRDVIETSPSLPTEQQFEQVKQRLLSIRNDSSHVAEMMKPRENDSVRLLVHARAGAHDADSLAREYQKYDTDLQNRLQKVREHQAQQSLYQSYSYQPPTETIKPMSRSQFEPSSFFSEQAHDFEKRVQALAQRCTEIEQYMQGLGGPASFDPSALQQVMRNQHSAVHQIGARLLAVDRETDQQRTWFCKWAREVKKINDPEALFSGVTQQQIVVAAAPPSSTPTAAPTPPTTAPAPAPAPAAAQTSLFGNTLSGFGAPASTAPATGTSLFGAPASTTPAAGTSLFGAPASSPAPATSFNSTSFGAPAAGNLFGAPAATAASSGTSLFGAMAASPAPAAGSAFGAPASGFGAPATGFGTAPGGFAAAAGANPFQSVAPTATPATTIPRSKTLTSKKR